MIHMHHYQRNVHAIDFIAFIEGIHYGMWMFVFMVSAYCLTIYLRDIPYMM